MQRRKTKVITRTDIIIQNAAKINQSKGQPEKSQDEGRINDYESTGRSRRRRCPNRHLFENADFVTSTPRKVGTVLL